MAIALGKLTLLIEEYRAILDECGISTEAESIDRERLIAALVRDAEWSEDAAQTLVSLAVNYGTFILRNALALACTLEIEDGEFGY